MLWRARRTTGIGRRARAPPLRALRAKPSHPPARPDRMPARSSLLVAAQEPEEQPAHSGDEDRGLLRHHECTADVLIFVCGHAEEARGSLIVGIERRQPGEREPEEDRREEGDEEVEEAGRGGEAVFGSAEHRPPEDEPGADENRVLGVEQDGMLEQRVVDAAEMDAVPRGEPGRERDRRSRERAEERPAPARDGAARAVREAEDQQWRRDVRSDRVLRQVCEQPVVGGQRLEGRVERKSDTGDARGEKGGAPRAAVLDAADVDGERAPAREQEERLEREARWSGSAHVACASIRPRGVARARRSTTTRNAMQIVRLASCSTIMTAPARRWSVSAPMPHIRTG